MRLNREPIHALHLHCFLYVWKNSGYALYYQSFRGKDLLVYSTLCFYIDNRNEVVKAIYQFRSMHSSQSSLPISSFQSKAYSYISNSVWPLKSYFKECNFDILRGCRSFLQQELTANCKFRYSTFYFGQVSCIGAHGYHEI